MFANMVRTDGYGIDFILTGPKKQLEELPDLELNDFTTEELNTRFHLWEVDPGMINIFTASDGHGNETHQLENTPQLNTTLVQASTKTNQHILNYNNGGIRFLEAERQITTHKAADLEVYREYVHSLLSNFDILLRFYDNRFSALRFLNYMGRQRANAEMVNIFVTGGKKYLKREFKQTGRDEKRDNRKRRKKKRVPAEKGKQKEQEKGKAKEKIKKRRMMPFQQDNRIPLVALGDAVFPTSMKGTIPGLSRRLVKLLKAAEYEGL